MINKLIGGLLSIVVGLALMPVIADSTSTLTGSGGTFEGTTTGSLIDLIPIIFVVVVVAATVLLVPSKK